MASAYVEVLRNTPLLLQLFFWYALSQALPGPREALNPLAGRLSLLPRLVPAGARLAGRPTWIASRPVLVGFDFHGGTSISPEFAALLDRPRDLHRGVHRRDRPRRHPAVDQGQTEAAAALGLSRARRCGSSCSRRRSR